MILFAAKRQTAHNIYDRIERACLSHLCTSQGKFAFQWKGKPQKEFT